MLIFRKFEGYILSRIDSMSVSVYTLAEKNVILLEFLKFFMLVHKCDPPSKNQPSSHLVVFREIPI